MTAMFDAVLRTLNSLDVIEAPTAQADLITRLAAQGLAHVKLPQPGNTWDSQRLEIDLHGIYAEGADWPEVIRAWTKAARAMTTTDRLRAAAVAEAITVIEGPLASEPEALAQACQTILEAPTYLTAATTRARADALARVLRAQDRAEGVAR